MFDKIEIPNQSSFTPIIVGAIISVVASYAFLTSCFPRGLHQLRHLYFPFDFQTLLPAL